MRDQPEPTPDAVSNGEASSGTGVQQAVEQFVELHSSGQAPDLVVFVERFALPLRPRILAQCREFLSLDGLLGRQKWEAGQRPHSDNRTFGDFEIQEELGRGGMGIVYLAHQRSLNRRVALKVMASGLTLSKRHVERFRREAAAAAQLRHPAIVPVHTFCEVDGTFALAMDFVAGRNLGDILDDLRLANGEGHTSIEGTLGIEPKKGYVAECAMLCAQLASALAAAHQAGVVHRDLKPRNLMIDDRRQARLLDFGLAKSLGDGSISMSGEITGTAHYLSPEQTLAKRVVIDHRADIWSLGVILYEVLTLQRPFYGKNLQQVIYEICFKEPVPPHKLNTKVPRDLVTICQKALEKDPQNRYQTAAEFEADLLRFLRWEPIHARPAGTVTRLLKWMRRHRAETMLAGAVGAIVAGVLGYSWFDAIDRDGRSSGLLAKAEQEAGRDQFDLAIQLATEALRLRDDAGVVARIDGYRTKALLAATMASRICLESSQQISHDRELAVLLALEADALGGSSKTRSAVLTALGGVYRTTTLRTGDDRDHVGQIISARWSPDGKRVVTTGVDGKVLLWDAAKGALTRTLARHEGKDEDKGWVVGAVFVGNGERLLTASADGTLRLWRTQDGSLEYKVSLPDKAAALRADRRGERVLVACYGSDDGPYKAQVFEASTGKAVSAPVVHDQLLVTLALSPCGEYAATCSGKRGAVRLWRTATGETIGLLDQGAENSVRAIAFAPDSSLVATAASDGAAHIYRVADASLLGTVRHSHEIRTLAFDGTSERLLTGSRDQTARLWQVQRDATGGLPCRELQTFVGHGGSLRHVGFDRTNGLAVTAGEDGVLRIFDAGSGPTPNGGAILQYELGPAIGTADFDPEGRRVLALAGSNRAVIWDSDDSRGVVTLRQPGALPAACFDATGDRIVTAGDDERLRLWNAHDGRRVWVTEPLGMPVRTLDVDDAGERIACSTVDGRVPGRIAVHRLVDGAPLFTLKDHTGSVPVVRFAAGGSRLLTAGVHTNADKSRTGRAIVWNMNDQSQVQVLSRPQPLVAADLSRDGALLATVEERESIVRLWSVPGGQPRGEVGGHTDHVLWVRFSPDGSTLLTASHDGTARIQTPDKRCLAVLDAGQRLQYATFSRDGSMVLTTSAAGNFEAQLWRVDGTELLRFHGHRGTVEWGAFNPDGTWAVTTSRDGTARIWPTEPVALAKRLPLRLLTAAEKVRHGLVRPAEHK
ncbi:MAG TPA: protein kinase [Planctomycetota bacterium]|nr:protein kinase [Planctomycetota bacterium]